MTLNNTASTSATHYMASESSTFEGARWKDYSNDPSFTLSATPGAKTVYFKVTNGAVQSPVVSASVTYMPTPAVKKLRINDGAATTTGTTVTLDNVVSGNPDEYIASESANFEGASWQTYSAAPSFVLSADPGKKTVYFKVRNDVGTSKVISDKIILE